LLRDCIIEFLFQAESELIVLGMIQGGANLLARQHLKWLALLLICAVDCKNEGNKMMR